MLRKEMIRPPPYTGNLNRRYEIGGRVEIRHTPFVAVEAGFFGGGVGMSSTSSAGNLSVSIPRMSPSALSAVGEGREALWEVFV